MRRFLSAVCKCSRLGHNHMNMLKKIILLFSLFLFPFAVWSEFQLPPGVVSKVDILQKVTAAGASASNKTTFIIAPYDGIIKKFYVDVGTDVKKGKPLFTLVEHTAQLVDQTYPLRAPFTGRVSHIFYEEGEQVDSKDTNKKKILRLDDFSSFYIKADIPEIDIAKVKLGQSVIIKFSALLNKNYKGTIEKISLAPASSDDWGKRNKVEFPTVVKLLNPDEKIRPGMSVILDIIIQEKKGVLALKHHYIKKEKGKYFVTTAAGEKKEVEVGIQNEEYFEITSGVQEGEKIRPVDFKDV